MERNLLQVLCEYICRFLDILYKNGALNNNLLFYFVNIFSPDARWRGSRFEEFLYLHRSERSLLQLYSRDRSSALDSRRLLAPLFNPSSAMAEVTGNFFSAARHPSLPYASWKTTHRGKIGNNGLVSRKIAPGGTGAHVCSRFLSPSLCLSFSLSTHTHPRNDTHARKSDTGVRANAKKPGLNK